MVGQSLRLSPHTICRLLSFVIKKPCCQPIDSLHPSWTTSPATASHHRSAAGRGRIESASPCLESFPCPRSLAECLQETLLHLLHEYGFESSGPPLSQNTRLMPHKDQSFVSQTPKSDTPNRARGTRGLSSDTQKRRGV